MNTSSAKQIVFMISRTNSGISEMQLRGMLQYSFRAQTAFHDAQCATFVEAWNWIFNFKNDLMFNNHITSMQCFVITRVALIVPACQPGWEEMENLRGNLKKFEEIWEEIIQNEVSLGGSHTINFTLICTLQYSLHFTTPSATSLPQAQSCIF